MLVLASAARGQQQSNCKRQGDKKRTPGGQEKDTKKTRERNQEDKKRTQGWPARPEDNSRTPASTRRTRGGRDPDTGFRGVPETVANFCFSKRNPKEEFTS